MGAEEGKMGDEVDGWRGEGGRLASALVHLRGFGRRDERCTGEGRDARLAERVALNASLLIRGCQTGRFRQNILQKDALLLFLPAVFISSPVFE